MLIDVGMGLTIDAEPFLPHDAAFAKTCSPATGKRNVASVHHDREFFNKFSGFKVATAAATV